MISAFVAVCIALGPVPPQSAPAARHLDRLVALAKLDAAVRYFDPTVATRASSWDSLFAANAVRIADARNAAEYSQLVRAMMAELHEAPLPAAGAQRAVRYDGFPTLATQTSGGYALRWRSAPPGESYTVEMGEGLRVAVRLTEAGADTTETAAIAPVPTDREWRAPYPTAGYRILAAARVWSTFNHFYPYKNLMGENWEARLREALPAAENASDLVEFNRAIMTLAAYTHDTHTTVGGPGRADLLGIMPAAATGRFIENKFVITRIVDPGAKAAGLKIGDVVDSVDDESVEQRAARFTPLIAASTPAALRYRQALSMLLGGMRAGNARLVVHGADGQQRRMTIERSQQLGPAQRDVRTGSIIRALPGNIGYIDIDRLPPEMVDSAFRTLAGTKAIILDNRGYPLGTFFAIGPRLLNRTQSVPAAKFRRLEVTSPDTAKTTFLEFEQTIPVGSAANVYHGKTVMLVDERAISQSEHTGLWFEAANGTEFIGSQTMGANGDITNFQVPGGISITFTGHDVRHADGRQLQRVGLQPHLAVSPTIAGIRAGRDEVLEAAHKYLGGSGEIPEDPLKDVVAPVVAVAPPPFRNAGIPGWRSSGTGGQFAAELDHTISRSGTSSGHLAFRTSGTGNFGQVSQTILADNFRGKRVRWSAWVRTSEITGTGAGLWMRTDGDGMIMTFDNMSDRSLRRAADWTRLFVVLDVPEKADAIHFGILLVGNGDAWIDDGKFEVVGADVPVTGSAPMAPSGVTPEAMRTMYASLLRAPANLAFKPASSAIRP